MKKFLSLMLALALVAGLGVCALAADLPEGWTPADGARELPEGWTPADGARDLPEGWTPADGARDDLPMEVEATIPQQYRAVITVNGVEVDTTDIPGAPTGYVPMRAVTEADEGTVEWIPEERSAFFSLDNNSINVNVDTGAVMLLFEVVEDVTAYFDPTGYTYLPVSFLNSLETVTVNDNPELDVERYDIVTSNSQPMVKLAKSILAEAEVGAGQKVGLADMVQYYEFGEDNYEELVAYLPMMINADTLIIAKPAEGKMEAAKDDLQNKLNVTLQNFEHYLEDPYKMAQGGQIVESPNGEYVMLIISNNNDKAIELFNAAYEA